jgi:hypothetical protein
MALRNLLLAAVFLVGAARGLAADFDGDGAADEFTVIHEAEKVAKEAAVKLANPWQKVRKSKKSPKGPGLVIGCRALRKNSGPRCRVFSSPMWADDRYIRVITKRDPLYEPWKKSLPAMKGEAIQLSTKAGMDILLYWDGRWRLFWPDEEP